MSVEVLCDRKGAVIGRVYVIGNGVLQLKSPSGALLGTYDPKTNKTRLPNGAVFGSGNLLMMLF